MITVENKYKLKSVLSRKAEGRALFEKTFRKGKHILATNGKTLFMKRQPIDVGEGISFEEGDSENMPNLGKLLKNSFRGKAGCKVVRLKINPLYLIRLAEAMAIKKSTKTYTSDNAVLLTMSVNEKGQVDSEIGVQPVDKTNKTRGMVMPLRWRD